MPPGPQRRDRQIPLGIVGMGADWERRFRPLIGRMKHGRIAAVCSAVPHEAAQLGVETGGEVFHSLRKLLASRSVRGLLILDSGMLREWAVTLAMESGLPVFVASPIDDVFMRCHGQFAVWEEEGAVFVPGVGLRATPSALRLRELVATTLGPVRQVEIRLGTTSQSDQWGIQAIDWCRSLLSSTVSSIEPISENLPGGCVMLCGRASPLQPPVRTEIRFSREDGETPSPGAMPFRARIVCAAGEAHLSGERDISWSTGSEQHEEVLEGDRSAEEVLVDLFLRRAVGGVVPVPSWAELREASRLWEAVREQLTQR